MKPFAASRRNRFFIFLALSIGSFAFVECVVCTVKKELTWAKWPDSPQFAQETILLKAVDLMRGPW